MMDSSSNETGSLTRLKAQLAGFKATASPLFPDWSLERLLHETQVCRRIKGNPIRAVYALDTSDATFFLKLTASTRLKDRWRHLLLPHRRWTEWRNLHRLRKKHIEAASPVLRGAQKRGAHQAFFLVTQGVGGSDAGSVAAGGAGILGRYLATLHRRGVFHADLHPENVIVQPNERPCLIDAQEVWFIPWLPWWLRVHNLGRLFWHLSDRNQDPSWWQIFLEAYNLNFARPIMQADIQRRAEIHRQRSYLSRSKRCCRNSSEFVVLKGPQLNGYKRREFEVKAVELQQAIQGGVPLKVGRVIAYQGLCIKIHRLKRFHRDRCLASWKMSRALEVRGIPVPHALAYLKQGGSSFFVSEFLIDSVALNDYLSALTDLRQKRRALNKLAIWMRSIHQQHIWQRDFKSSNILCRDGQYFVIDLDSVAIRRLTRAQQLANLVQLNASLSNAVTLRDRVRFFCHYFGPSLPERSQRRKIYQQIWTLTQKKNTTVFRLELNQLGCGPAPRKGSL